MIDLLGKVKNNRTLLFVYLISIISSYLLIKCSSVNFSEYRNSAIQFNLFSFNGLIAGFLFTGLSIIMTIAEKDGISRLYKGGYLDQFYNTLILGIIHHIAAIAIGLGIILRPNETNIKWIMFQFANEVIGVFLFIASVFYLQYLLRLMKKYRKDS